MSTNGNLQDIAVRHALTILRYGAGVSDKIVKLLNSADADILAKIAVRLSAIEERGYDIGPRTTERLQRLLVELKELNTAIYQQLHNELMNELVQFGAVEAEFQRDALKAALVVDLATVLPSSTRLKAIVETAPLEGRLLRDWVNGMKEARVGRMAQAIRLGLVQGESTDKIVARIRGTKAKRYSDGILDISRRSAQSIVRTAVTHVSNVASQEVWRANSNIVKEWRFLATLDGRTTLTCAGLDGQTFALGSGPIPPRHIRCRSISVAVTKSWREMGIDRDELSPEQRASIDGALPGNPRFADWLKGKSPEFQDQVLGKARAEMFRTGKLDLNQFVRGDGEVLTLKELKSRYGDILS
jgi:SPP1 gp7 family putative phage head morphogenesis protein